MITALNYISVFPGIYIHLGKRSIPLDKFDVHKRDILANVS